MAIIGDAFVEVRAITDKLERDIKSKLDQITDKFTVKVDADTAAAQAKIEQLIDGVDTAELTMPLVVHTEAAQEHLDSFKEQNDGTTVGFSADPFTTYASARFRYLARPRFVEFIAKVNEAAFAQVASTLASLSGGKYVVDRLETINRYLLDIGSHVPRLSTVSTAIAGIAGAVGALVSNILVLGGELAAIVPLALTLPGIMAGFAIGIGATIAVMKDFKTRLSDLGPQFTALQDQMSNNFWAIFEAPMRRLVDTLFPEFAASMNRVSEALGRFFAELANSVTEELDADTLRFMMDNLTQSIDIAKDALQPLTEAFVILGSIGSMYLPTLAEWFVRISNNFSDFISKSSESGAIFDWIDTAIQNLKDLGGIVVETSVILYNLYNAARLAGGSGLSELRAALQNIADITGKEPFQTTLIQFFRGSHAAMEGMLSALVPLGNALVTLGPTIESSLGTAGLIIGEVGHNIAELLEAPAMATGLTSLFDGILAGVSALRPAMAPLGDAMGTFLSLVGALAAQLGPVVSAAIQALAPAFTTIMDALIPLLPMLSESLIGAIESLAPGIQVLADNLAAMLPTIISAAAGFLDFIAAISDAGGPNLLSIVAGLVGISGAAVKISGPLGIAKAAFDTLRDVDGPLARIGGVIASLASKINLAGIAAGIFRGVMVVLNVVLRANPIGLIVTALTLLVGGVVLAYNKIGWFKDFVNGAFESIKVGAQAVADFWNNTLVPVFQNFGTIISGMWTTVTTFFSTGIAAIGAIWNGFWGTLGLAVSTGLAALGASIMSFLNPLIVTWNAFWAGFRMVFDMVWSGLITFLMPILVPLGELIMSTVNGIKQAWDFVWSSMAMLWTQFWTGLGTALAPLLLFIQTTISAGLAFIQSVWNVAWGVVRDSFMLVWNTIVAFFTPIFAQIRAVITAGLAIIQSIWSTVWNTVASVASVVWNNIRMWISAGIQAVSSTISSTMSFISSVWNAGWNAIRGLISAVWSAMQGIVTGAIANLRGNIASGMSFIQSVWSNGWSVVRSAISVAFNMMVAAAVSFVTGLRDNIVNAIALVTGLRDRVVGALSGAASWLVSVGQDMIAGLIAGIQGAVGGVIDAARNLASSAVETVKGILKINSPSKVFIGIGESVNEGFSDGIVDSTSASVSAASRMADNVIAAAENGMRALGDISVPVAQFRSLGEQMGDGIATGLENSRSTIADAASSAMAGVVPTSLNVSSGATGSSQISVPNTVRYSSTQPREQTQTDTRVVGTETTPIQFNVHPPQGADSVQMGQAAAAELWYILDNR